MAIMMTKETRKADDRSRIGTFCPKTAMQTTEEKNVKEVKVCKRLTSACLEPWDRIDSVRYRIWMTSAQVELGDS